MEQMKHEVEVREKVLDCPIRRIPAMEYHE